MTMKSPDAEFGQGVAIFDFDGTLADLPVDWMAMKTGLAAFVAREYGSEIDTACLAVALRDIEGRFGRSALRASHAIVADFEERAMPELKPLSGALSTLRQAHRRGHLVAICSNNMTATIARSLERLKVADLVSQVVGRDTVSRCKPSPEGLKLILRKSGVLADHAVLVGDSADDEEAASRAGVRFVKAEEHDRMIRLLSAGESPDRRSGGETLNRAGAAWSR